MIRGALAVSEGIVADIMVPRSRMDLLDVTQPIPYLVASVIETAHSRFPVYEGDRDNIIGILLAKDLLRCMLEPGIEVRSLVRPAVFIPESKRLNVLLREFRVSRNHLAIVIDEHGGISGLVTMEDVLEQIVGDIEDEFDETEEDSIFPEGENQWRARGHRDLALQRRVRQQAARRRVRQRRRLDGRPPGPHPAPRRSRRNRRSAHRGRPRRRPPRPLAACATPGRAPFRPNPTEA